MIKKGIKINNVIINDPEIREYIMYHFQKQRFKHFLNKFDVTEIELIITIPISHEQ